MNPWVGAVERGSVRGSHWCWVSGSHSILSLGKIQVAARSGTLDRPEPSVPTFRTQMNICNSIVYSSWGREQALGRKIGEEAWIGARVLAGAGIEIEPPGPWASSRPCLLHLDDEGVSASETIFLSWRLTSLRAEASLLHAKWLRNFSAGQMSFSPSAVKFGSQSVGVRQHTFT